MAQTHDKTADFLTERNALVKSLRAKGDAFHSMSRYIAAAQDEDVLKQRIADCQRSPDMFGGGVDA